jgi:hypothetical protein
MLISRIFYQTNNSNCGSGVVSTPIGLLKRLDVADGKSMQVRPTASDWAMFLRASIP